MHSVLFLARQPSVGQGLLIHQVSCSHNDAPQSTGLLWTSDQFVEETCALLQMRILRAKFMVLSAPMTEIARTVTVTMKGKICVSFNRVAEDSDLLGCYTVSVGK
jgi:hypothetical protein